MRIGSSSSRARPGTRAVPDGSTSRSPGAVGAAAGSEEPWGVALDYGDDGDGDDGGDGYCYPVESRRKRKSPPPGDTGARLSAGFGAVHRNAGLGHRRRERNCSS
jgi:hypothetical protein